MLILVPSQSTPSSIASVMACASSPVNLPHQLPAWSLDVKVFKANSENKFLYQVTTTSQTGRDSKIVVGGKLYPTGRPDTIAYHTADPLDSIIQSKLQNQWTLRQSLNGDNSFAVQTYLKGMKLKIKGINVFLQGNFRSLIIIVEGTNDEEEIKQLLQLPEVKCYRGKSVEQLIVHALGLE